MTRHAWPIVLAALLLPASVLGASFLDRPYGTPEFGLSARARAMGGADAAVGTGAYGLAGNPATLALDPRTSFDAELGVSRASENRFVPLFDTFDSFVDETAIAINDNVYGTFNGGVMVQPPWPGEWVLSAGVFNRLDPRYDYYDERRSTATTDQIVSERFIRTRGMLRTWSFGAARPIARRGTVGAAVHWYDGNLYDRDALVPRTSPAAGRVTELHRRLSGWSASVGGTFDVDERLRAALAFETPPQLTNRYQEVLNDSLVASGKTDLELPMRVHAGGAYRPRNAMRTTFLVDVIYMPWSDLDDPQRPGQELLDTWDVRFGLEHEYVRGVPARLGFRYARSNAMREADRVTFTFGFGYQVERLALDFAGEVGKANSRQDPLWARAEQGPAVGAGQDRVEDTFVRAYLGVRYAP
jgi:hypothetical protein